MITLFPSVSLTQPRQSRRRLFRSIRSRGGARNAREPAIDVSHPYASEDFVDACRLRRLVHQERTSSSVVPVLERGEPDKCRRVSVNIWEGPTLGVGKNNATTC
jgi:hypothetical protein